MLCLKPRASPRDEISHKGAWDMESELKHDVVKTALDPKSKVWVQSWGCFELVTRAWVSHTFSASVFFNKGIELGQRFSSPFCH